MVCSYICIDICKCVFVVHCPNLLPPINGTINCTMKENGAPSYEDTCSFTCNTGYELTGSDTRTCQSNGSWSGNDTVCRRGNFCMFCITTSCKQQYLHNNNQDTQLCVSSQERRVAHKY